MLFTLPNYQPIKNPIEFECILGESISKVIELENPTNKTITYSVNYEGSQDFILEEMNVIKVEGKSTFKYRVIFLKKVVFVSRISSSQKGRIWFTSKKEGNEQVAQALVFDLMSNITGRKSIHVFI